MFHCKYLVEYMDWHAKNRSGQDVLHIPIDFEAMKHIENTWPEKFICE
jgi:hypothetical protein